MHLLHCRAPNIHFSFPTGLPRVLRFTTRDRHKSLLELLGSNRVNRTTHIVDAFLLDYDTGQIIDDDSLSFLNGRHMSELERTHSLGYVEVHPSLDRPRRTPAIRKCTIANGRTCGEERDG